MALGIITDVALSLIKDPETGKLLQSWLETGVNTGVGITAMVIGGVPGVMLGGLYYIGKDYIKFSQVHPELFDNQDWLH